MQVDQSSMEQNTRDGGENRRDSHSINMVLSISDKSKDNSKPVDVSSRVWRLFLDSKCSSATVFFRLHLSARTYFHSPTPWNPGSASNLSRKVSALLDSFRPGSSSYSPFEAESDENNNQSQNNENVEDENNNREFQLLRPSVIAQRVIEESNQTTRNAWPIENYATYQERSIENMDSSTDDSSTKVEENQTTSLTLEEENRRRLYLNLGRPRPFYRVTSREDEITLSETKNTKKKRLLSLKEEAKNQIVAMYGLTNLKKILKETKTSLKLPETIKNFLFTFPCHDFEENGYNRPQRSASYNVRFHLDGKKYTAIFATSEADKAVSNLWEDEKDWLKITVPGVTQILAIAVDPLTENIFYIIPERGTALTDVIDNNKDQIDMGDGKLRGRDDVAETVRKEITSTLTKLQKSGKSYGPLREENVFFFQGKVLIENQLLVKSCAFQDFDEKEEHSQNLLRLNVIIANILAYNKT